MKFRSRCCGLIYIWTITYNALNNINSARICLLKLKLLRIIALCGRFLGTLCSACSIMSVSCAHALPSLLGHDECSPISTVQTAGQKGKQTQQATVVDLFIGPQSSSQASAPYPGPDSQTSNFFSLKRNTQMEERKLTI